MIHRTYDAFGIVDGVPGYIYLYADERVATRAPSDPEVLAVVLEALEANVDRLTLSPALTLAVVKPELTDYLMTQIALTVDPQRVWDRYIRITLMNTNCKVFARN
jgi:hypothetical protein